jgi:uncharacterized metal-binding protein YceD (DUF177 family)
MSAELPWSHEIEVAALPQEGRTFKLVPDEATRSKLAEHAEVLGVPELSVTIKVRPTAAGAEATGELSGAVRQRCVVSLEEFDNPVSEQIEVDFADAAEDAAPEDEAEEDLERPDPIVDGKIDLGALAAEFLVLAVDPYPRKPGAQMPNLPGDEAENASGKSPFASLSGLKNRIKK